MYDCSDGTKLSESAIQAKYSKALRERYQDAPNQRCHGCGEQAVCSAHIIPKARLKQLHIAEMIFNPVMFFPACFKCNTIAENISSERITTLKNYQEIKVIIMLYDPERAAKLPE